MIERVVIQISKPVKAWLDAVKDEQQQRLGRQVTYSEIIEQLRERADAA